MSQQVSSSRNWRKTEESTKSTRYTAIVLLALFAIAAFVVLIIVLIPRSKPQPGLVWFEVPGYKTDISGIPFASEQASRVENAQLPFRGERRESVELTGAGQLRKLPETLQSVFKDSKDKDVAIVYVTAHGISEAKPSDLEEADESGMVATAYLLGSDFEFDLPSTRISIDVLIEAMEKVPSKTKLLLLDTAYYASDIRYGMAVNEFPYLLEQALKESEDPSLWVIHSSGLLQTSQVTYGGEQPGSVFAKAVRGAFNGLGDDSIGQSGEPISLLRFYRRIAQWCWTYAPQSSEYAQTPFLMRGGVGFLDAAEHDEELDEADELAIFYRVLKIEKPKKKEESSKDDGKDEGGSAALRRSNATISSLAAHFGTTIQPLVATLAPPHSRLASIPMRHVRRTGRRSPLPVRPSLQDDNGDGDNGNGDSAETGGQDEGSDEDPMADEGDEDTAAPKLDPAEAAMERVSDHEGRLPSQMVNELRKELNQVHLLVDRLNARANTHNWSPVDFAPDLWSRQLIRISRMDERAMYAQPGSEAFDLRLREAKRIRQQLSDLHSRIDTGAAGSSSRDLEQGDVGLKLLDAWHQLVTTQTGDPFQTWQSNDRNENAVIRYLRVYHDVLFRAKLYVRLNEEMSPIVGTGFVGDIRSLLDELNSQRERFEQNVFGDIDQGFEFVSLDLRNAANDLRRAEEQCFLSLETILNTVTEIEKAGNTVIAQRILVVFLQSPLLPMLGPEGNDRDSRRLAKISRAFVELELGRILEAAEPTVASESQGIALPSAVDFFGTSEQWQRVVERMELRVELLRLAVDSDSSATEPFDIAEQAVRELRIPSAVTRGSVDKVLGEVRKANDLLRKAYEAIIADGQRLRDADTQSYRARRIAGVTDIRDPDLFGISKPNMMALRFVHQREKERIVFSDSRYDPSFEGMTHQLQIPLEIGGYQPNTIDVRVASMQSDVFTIMHKGVELKSDQSFPVQVNKSGDTVVTLDIRAKVDRANVPATFVEGSPYIQLRAHGVQPGAENDPTETAIYLKPPLPQFVDLIVQQPNTGVWEPSSPDGVTDNNRREVFPGKQPIECVRVRPYSSRNALFNLYLVNRSGLDVTANIELFQIERPPGNDDQGFPIALLPGRVTSGVGLGNEPYPQLATYMRRRISGASGRKLEPIASTTQPLELPRANKAFPTQQETFDRLAVPIVFGAPLPEDAPEGTPAPPPLPVDPLDISNGLLCRITIDGWGSEPVVQERWIEFTPTLAADFLDVANLDEPALRYEEASDTIKLQLVAATGSKYPKNQLYPWDFFEELKLNWAEKNALDYPSEYKLDCVLSVENPNGVMNWRIGTESYPEKRWRVGVDVEGYPRALIYDVEVGEDDDIGTYARNSAGRLRDDVRIYRILGLVGEGEAEEVVWRVDDDSQIVNGAGWLGECDRIKIEYRIDGPLGPMSVLNPEQLATGDEQFVETYVSSGNDTFIQDRSFFDRTVRTWMLFGKDGIEFRSEVEDLSMEIDLSRVPIPRNVPVGAFARLNVGREKMDSERTFGIDMKKPRLVSIDAKPDDNPVRVGKKDSFTIQIEALDEESGVTASGVKFYLDPQPDRVGWKYETGQKELQTLQARAAGLNRWEIVLTGENLGEGEHQIVPRIVDAVGLEADVARDQVINVFVDAADTLVADGDPVDPGSGDGEMEEDKTFEIRVKVLMRDRPVARIDEWKLNDAVVDPERVEDGGGYVFAFKDLEAGEYKIEALYTTTTKQEAVGAKTFKLTPDSDSIVKSDLIVK